MTTEPRINIQVKLRPDAIAALDSYAQRLGLTRSDVIRECIAAGLPVVAKRANTRPAPNLPL